MADVGGTLTGLFGSIFTGGLAIALWVTLGIIVISLVGGLGYYFFIYKKKFDIMAKIISQRAGDDKVFFDKAAILKDKRAKKSYLKLFNSNVELELPKFKIFYNTNKGDYVEILRTSERGFYFLTPPRVEKRYAITHAGKRIPMADVTQRQIEMDIGWIVGRMKDNKKIIDPQSLLMQILAYTPQIISMTVSMIILYIILRYAPNLLSSFESYITRLEGSNAAPKTEVIGGLMLLGRSIWKKKT